MVKYDEIEFPVVNAFIKDMIKIYKFLKFNFFKANNIALHRSYCLANIN